MAIYTDNPLNSDTLPYSGFAVFAFAVIYYFIQQNSYCNENAALCKNPVLVNSELEPNERIINNSTDSIVHHIKCEPLPAIDITTYSTMTNKSVAFYALVLTGILGLFLLITNSYSDMFKDIMFNEISKPNRDEYVNPVLYAGIGLSALIAIVNYIKRGYESESVFLLIITFIIMSIVCIAFVKRNTKKSHIELQSEILLIICIAIGFITITNLRYIYNLQVGHALISSGAYVTIIIQLITIVLLGIALIDNYDTLITNPIEYILYIIIFITILIQTAFFGSHIYKCVWKTYECTPDISIIQEDSDMTKLKISCNTNLKFDKSAILFVLLAILFVILPSDWAIDYILNSVDYIVKIVDYIFDSMNKKFFD
jgi:hypothetical protein